MTHARQAFGLHGEDLACEALVQRGYTILTRRYRTRAGELDIIAEHRGYVVFVEVKTRQDGSFGDPEESVTLKKQQRVVGMASDYLMRSGDADVPCRFDVVSINTSTDPPTILVIEDAFRPGW